MSARHSVVNPAPRSECGAQYEQSEIHSRQYDDEATESCICRLYDGLESETNYDANRLMIQRAQEMDIAKFDEVSPTGPAAPLSAVDSVNNRLPEADTELQQQLVDLIHVLRRIALARRVSLETAKQKLSNNCPLNREAQSTQQVECTTQQIIDLLLLAKSMAGQAMEISNAKTTADDSHKQKRLYRNTRPCGARTSTKPARTARSPDGARPSHHQVRNRRAVGRGTPLTPPFRAGQAAA